MIKQIYDIEADAFYVKVKNGKVAHTKDVGLYLIDFNKAGQELGYEILNFSRNRISEIKGIKINSPFSTIKFSTFSSSELGRFDKSSEPVGVESETKIASSVPLPVI